MRVGVIVLVGLAIGTADVASGDTRKWTDSTGTFSAEAELVKLEGGIVTLKLAGGSLKKIPLRKLSPGDREFVESAATKPVGAVSSSYGREFRGDYYPEIRNGKGQEQDQEIPLGPIGGEGRGRLRSEGSQDRRALGERSRVEGWARSGGCDPARQRQTLQSLQQLIR